MKATSCPFRHTQIPHPNRSLREHDCPMISNMRTRGICCGFLHGRTKKRKKWKEKLPRTSRRRRNQQVLMTATNVRRKHGQQNARPQLQHLQLSKRVHRPSRQKLKLRNRQALLSGQYQPQRQKLNAQRSKTLWVSGKKGGGAQGLAPEQRKNPYPAENRCK